MTRMTRKWYDHHFLEFQTTLTIVVSNHAKMHIGGKRFTINIE